LIHASSAGRWPASVKKYLSNPFRQSLLKQQRVLIIKYYTIIISACRTQTISLLQPAARPKHNTCLISHANRRLYIFILYNIYIYSIYRFVLFHFFHGYYSISRPPPLQPRLPIAFHSTVFATHGIITPRFTVTSFTSGVSDVLPHDGGESLILSIHTPNIYIFIYII